MDFAARTQANLKIIERLAKQDVLLLVNNPSDEIDEDGVEAYEVTQLVNSILGLIVFPQQRYYDQIPEIPLSQLEIEGWPKPLLQGEIPNDLNNLRDLMRYIRNSIAHFNIEFTSDSGGRINGVKIWNSRNNRRNWTASLQIDALKSLVEKFIALVVGLK
jgi:hypothetical protein